MTLDDAKAKLEAKFAEIKDWTARQLYEQLPDLRNQCEYHSHGFCPIAMWLKRLLPGICVRVALDDRHPNRVTLSTRSAGGLSLLMPPCVCIVAALFDARQLPELCTEWPEKPPFPLDMSQRVIDTYMHDWTDRNWLIRLIQKPQPAASTVAIAE
jgi:hypothetical protein